MPLHPYGWEPQPVSERSEMSTSGLLDADAVARRRAGDRRLRGRLSAGIGAVLACVVAATVVGVTVASAAPRGKPTLTIGITTGPSGNDPSKVEPDPFDEVNLSLMDAPLLHQNPDGSISPGLATSWHYIGGNKTFALTLRHNARFSDGSQVTAQAVKAWLTYFPKSGSSLASMLGKLRAIDTPTRWDVVIHLESPNPIIPTILSEAFNWGYVVAPNYVRNPTLFANQGGGAGPYVLDPSQTVSGDHYTYLPNKYFYDPAAIKYSKVVVRVISSPSSMLAAAQTGQVDVALGDTTTATAAKRAGLNVISKPTQTESFVFLDLAGKLNPALADPRVRQALNYAIDRQAIAKALFGPYATPTSEYLSPYGFDPKYQNYYAYNPAKAKALLAAAGYAQGLTVDFLSATFEGTLGDPVTQAVAQDFANVGVKLQITSEPTGSAFGAAIGAGTHDGFELLYGGDPMPIHWGFYFAPKAPFNEHGWSDPVLDKMMIQSMRLPTVKASKLWLKMSARTVTEGEMLPILFADQIWYVSKHVRGVAFSSNAQVPYPTEWSPR